MGHPVYIITLVIMIIINLGRPIMSLAAMEEAGSKSDDVEGLSYLGNCLLVESPILMTVVMLIVDVDEVASNVNVDDVDVDVNYDVNVDVDVEVMIDRIG